MDYLYDNIVKRSSSLDESKSSRYRRLARIMDDEGNQYIESASDLSFPKKDDDRYHIVTAGEANRLDLISNQYYGTPLLYWVIAVASELEDPLEVPSGTTLRIPSHQSLYGYKGVLA